MSIDDTQLAPEENDDKTFFAPVPMQEPIEFMKSSADQQPDDDIEAQLALQNLEKRRRDKRRKKRIKIALACALVGGVAAVVFGRRFMTPEPEEIEYAPETVEVMRQDFQDVVSSSGALKAGSTVVVSPEVDGVIESIRVTEGEEVEKGDVLFTVKNDELDKAVREAQQELDSAERGITTAQDEVAKAQAARDKAWDEYRKEWNEAEALHAEWQQSKDSYNERVAQYEEDLVAYDEAYNAAEELRCAEPTPPEKYEGEDPDKKAAYDDAYAEYLILKDEWDAYQRALAMVPAEPTPPEPVGEEPGYPEEPDDDSLVDAIDSANAAVETAVAARDKAQETYDETVETASKRTVTAPSAGNVVSINGKVGESVAGSGNSDGYGGAGGVVQISDIKQMAVDIEVNEIDILKLKKGQTAKVTFSAVPDVECNATVSAVAKVASGQGDAGGGGIVTFHVGLVIPVPDDKLRPGMTANVKIFTVDMKDVLVVPTSAIMQGEEGSSVEVVVDEETMETETRLVKTGASNSSETVVEEGLSEGDVVLLSGGGMSGLGEGDMMTDGMSGEF